MKLSFILFLFCGIFYVLPAQELLGTEIFYEIGKNKIEFRDADYYYKRTRDDWIIKTDPNEMGIYISRKAFLNQNDLQAISIIEDGLIFYFKIRSLNKIHRFSKTKLGFHVAVFINGTLVDTPLVNMDSSFIRFSVNPPEPFGAHIRKNFKKRAPLDKQIRHFKMHVWLANMLRKNQKNLAIRRELLFVYIDQKECEKAAAFFTLKYFKRFDLSSARNIGRCFLDNYMYNQSILFYDRIFKDYSEPNVLILRAEAYKEFKRYSLALRDINKYLKKYARPPYVSPERARILFEMKSYDKAFEDYKRILKKKPEDSDMLNEVARAYVSINRNLKEALKLSKAAVRFQANNSYYLDTLAEIYLKLGRLEEAEKANNKAIKLTDNPDLAMSLLERRREIQMRKQKK